MRTSDELVSLGPPSDAVSATFFKGEYIVASPVGAFLQVRLLLETLNNPVLSARVGEAARYFRQWMVSLGDDLLDVQDSVYTIGLDDPAGITATLEDIDRRLKKQIEAPISPKNVEKCLKISGKERNRWMNDGRLPSCLSRRASKAQGSFLIPFYSSSLIRELYTQPDMLKSWREIDAATARANKQLEAGQ